MMNIFGEYVQGDNLVISDHVFVPLETFYDLFSGCVTIDDFIERDAGEYGYMEFLLRVKNKLQQQ